MRAFDTLRIHRYTGSERGLALPVVLLVIAAMAGIALKLVAETRLDLAVARNIRAEAEAEAAADAAIHFAMAKLMEDETDLGTGAPLIWDYQSAAIKISIEPESAKIDLNVGAPPLIERALEIAGAAPDEVEALAEAIVARRDIANGEYYRRVEELQTIDGMTPRLFKAVAPMMTVYSAQPGFDLASAPVAVLQTPPGMTRTMAEQVVEARAAQAPAPPAAISMLRPYRGAARDIYRIRADARLESGARFIRDAVVDLSRRQAPIVFEWRRISAPSQLAGR